MLEGEEVVVTRLSESAWQVDVLKGDPAGGDGLAAYCTAPAGKGPFPRGPFTLQGNYAVPFKLLVREVSVLMWAGLRCANLTHCPGGSLGAAPARIEARPQPGQPSYSARTSLRPSQMSRKTG